MAENHDPKPDGALTGSGYFEKGSDSLPAPPPPTIEVAQPFQQGEPEGPAVPQQSATDYWGDVSD
ncbi:hypothetical protein GCM10009619_42230 [Williamsia maris]